MKMNLYFKSIVKLYFLFTLLYIVDAGKTGELQPGVNADCYNHANRKYYAATIESTDDSGNWTVKWHDGDEKDTTGHPKQHFKNIGMIGELEPGIERQCLHQNGDYYAATLVSIDNDSGDWTVKWHDGDLKDTTGHPQHHFIHIGSTAGLQPGINADCYNLANNKYYAATIVSTDDDGTSTVKWHDGDTKDTTGHPLSHFKNIGMMGELQPDITRYCLHQNFRYYPATLVSKDNDSGKWTVEWHDGDTKDTTEHPPSHFIHIDNTRGLQPDINADCYSLANDKYYAATIVSTDDDGKSTVKWHDGDGKDTTGHPLSHFKNIGMIGELQPGMTRNCLHQNGAHYPATLVSKDNDSGNWTVKWVDGDKKDKTRHPPSHFKDIVDTAGLQPGINADCYHTEKQEYYAATILSTDDDGKSTVMWHNGDTSDTTEHPEGHFTNIGMIGELQPGITADCLHQNGGLYRATLGSKDNDSGNWTVVWHDGDTKDTTGHPESHFFHIDNSNRKI